MQGDGDRPISQLSLVEYTPTLYIVLAIPSPIATNLAFKAPRNKTKLGGHLAESPQKRTGFGLPELALSIKYASYKVQVRLPLAILLNTFP